MRYSVIGCAAEGAPRGFVVLATRAAPGHRGGPGAPGGPGPREARGPPGRGAGPGKARARPALAPDRPPPTPSS